MPLYEKFIRAIGKMNFDAEQGKELHQILLQKEMAALNAAEEALKKAIADKEKATTKETQATQNQEAVKLQQEYMKQLEQNLQQIQADQEQVKVAAAQASLDITTPIKIPQDFAQNFAKYFQNIQHVQVVLEDAPPEIVNLQTDIIFEVLASVPDKKEKEKQIQKLTAEEIKQILTSTIKKATENPEEAKKYRQLIQMLLFEVINREVTVLPEHRKITAKEYEQFFTNLNSKLPSRKEVGQLTLLDDFSEYKDTSGTTPAQLLASVQEKVEVKEINWANEDFFNGAKAYRHCTDKLRFGQADRRAYAEKVNAHMLDALFDARNRHENTIFTQNTSLALYFLNLVASRKATEKDNDLRKKIHAQNRDLDADAIVKLKEVVTDVAVKTDLQKKYQDFITWHKENSKSLLPKYRSLPKEFNPNMQPDVYSNYLTTYTYALYDVLKMFQVPRNDDSIVTWCTALKQHMQDHNIINQSLTTNLNTIIKDQTKGISEPQKKMLCRLVEDVRWQFSSIPDEYALNKQATLSLDQNLQLTIGAKLSAEQHYDIKLDEQGNVILTLNYFVTSYVLANLTQEEYNLLLTDPHIKALLDKKKSNNYKELSFDQTEFQALQTAVQSSKTEKIKQLKDRIVFLKNYTPESMLNVEGNIILQLAQNSEKLSDALTVKIYGDTLESIQQKISDPNNTTVLHEHMLKAIRKEYEVFEHIKEYLSSATTAKRKEALIYLIKEKKSSFGMALGAQGGYTQCYSEGARALYDKFISFESSPGKTPTALQKNQPTCDSLSRALEPFIREQNLSDADLLKQLKSSDSSVFNKAYLEIMQKRIHRIDSYKAAMQEKLKTVAADLEKKFKDAIPQLNLGEKERLFYQLLQLYQLYKNKDTPDEVKRTFTTLQEAFKAFDAGFNNTDESLTIQAIQDFANNLIDTELDTLCPEGMSHEQYKHNLARKTVNNLTYQEKDFLFNKRRKQAVQAVLNNTALETNLQTAYTTLARFKSKLTQYPDKYSDAVKKGIETAEKLVSSAKVRVEKTKALTEALAETETKTAIEKVEEIYKQECSDMDEELQLTITQKTELNAKIHEMVNDNITLMRRIERGGPVLQSTEVDAYFDAIFTIAQELQKHSLTMEDVRFKITHGKQQTVEIFNVAGGKVATVVLETNLPYSLYKAPGQSDFHFSFGGTRGINASFGDLDEAYGQRRRLFTNMLLLGVGQYGAVKEVENLITGINQILKKGVTGKEIDAFKEAARKDPRFRAITARTDPLFDVESPLLRALSEATADRTSKTASWTEIETKKRNTEGLLFQSEHPEAYYILTSLAKGETYADTARKAFGTSSKGDAAYHNPLAPGRKEQQPVSDIISLSRSIVEKSQYYQKLGFTHNDIKPENFLYLRKEDGTYEVKFIDWATGGFSQEYKGTAVANESTEDNLKRIFKEKFGVDWPTTGCKQDSMISDIKGRFVSYDKGRYTFGIKPTLQITYGAHNCTLPYICPYRVKDDANKSTVLDTTETTMDDWALTAMIFGICKRQAYFDLANGRVVSDYTVPGAIEPDGKGGLKVYDQKKFNDLFACGAGDAVMFIPGNSREGEPLHLYRRLDDISKKLNKIPEQQELKRKIDAILNTAHTAIAGGVGLTKEVLLGNGKDKKGLLAEAEDCVQQYEKSNQNQSTLANANLLASVLDSIDDKTLKLQDLDDKINIPPTSQGLPAEPRSIALGLPPHPGAAATGPGVQQHEVSKLEVLCTSPVTPVQQKKIEIILKKLVDAQEFNNRFALSPTRASQTQSEGLLEEQPGGNHSDLLQKCIAHGRADVLKTLLSKIIPAAKDNFMHLVTTQGLIHYAMQQGMTDTAKQIIAALNNAGATQEEIYDLIIKTYGPTDNQPHIKWATDAFDIAIRNGNLDQLKLLLAQIPESPLTTSLQALDKALHTAAVYTNAEAFEAILKTHQRSAEEILSLGPPADLSPYHLFLKNERTLNMVKTDELNANKAQEFLLGRADTPADQDTPGISSTTSSVSTSPIDSASSPTTPTASASSIPPTSLGLSRNRASYPLLIAAKNGNRQGVRKILELAGKANLQPEQWRQLLTQKDLDGKNILNHLLEHNDVALFTEVLKTINTDRRLGLGPTTTADMLGQGPTYDVAQQASAILTTLLSNPDPVNPLNNFLKNGPKEQQLDVLTQALNGMSEHHNKSSKAQQEDRAAIILHNKQWFYEQAKDEKNHGKLQELLKSDALDIVHKQALYRRLGLGPTTTSTDKFDVLGQDPTYDTAKKFFAQLLGTVITLAPDKEAQVKLTIPLIEAKVLGLQGSDQSAKILQLYEEIEKLRAQNVNQIQEALNAQKKQEQTEAALQKLQATYNAQIVKEKDLNTELDTAQESLKALQSSSTAEKEKLTSEAKQHIADISSKLTLATEEIQKTKVDMQTTLAEYKKSSEEKLTKLTEETKQQIDKLTQEFSSKNATEQKQSQAALEKAKAELETNLAKAKSEYATKLNELTTAQETKVQELTAAHQIETQQLTAGKEKIQKELQTLTDTVKTNQKIINKLQQEIEAIQLDRTHTDNINHKLLAQITTEEENHNEEMTRLKQSIAELTKTLKTAGADKEKLTAEFQELQAEQTALTQKHAESTARLDELTKKAEADQVVHTNALNETLKELTAVKKENETLQAQLNTLQETGGKKDTATKTQIEQLTTNLGTQKAELEIIRTQLTTEQQSLATKTQEFTDKLKELNTENKKLTETLAQKQEQIGILEATLEKQKEETKRAREVIVRSIVSAHTQDVGRRLFNTWRGRTAEAKEERTKHHKLELLESMASRNTRQSAFSKLKGFIVARKTQKTEAELEMLKAQQQKAISQKQEAIELLRSAIEELKQQTTAGATQTVDFAKAQQTSSSVEHDKTTADLINDLAIQQEILAKSQDLLARTQELQELQELQQAFELTAPLTNVRGSVVHGSDNTRAQPNRYQPTSAQPGHDQPSRDRKEAEQLTAEIVKLKESVTKTQAAIHKKTEQLQQDLQAQTKAVSESAAQVTALTATLQQQEAVHRQLQTRLEAQQQEVQKAEATIVTQKTAFEKKAADLVTKHDAAQADLQKKITEVIQELGALKTTHANQTTELQTQIDTNTSQGQEIAQKASKITELEESLREHITATVVEKNEFTQKLKQLKTDSEAAVAETKKQLEAAQTKFTTTATDLKQQIKTNAETITTLQTDLAAQQASTARSEKEKSVLESQITDLKRANVAIQAELGKQQTAYTATLDTHQKELTEKTKKFEASQAQNHQLQTQLNSAQQANAELTAKVEVQTQEVEELQEKIQTLDKSNATLCTELNITEKLNAAFDAINIAGRELSEAKIAASAARDDGTIQSKIAAYIAANKLKQALEKNKQALGTYMTIQSNCAATNPSETERFLKNKAKTSDSDDTMQNEQYTEILKTQNMKAQEEAAKKIAKQEEALSSQKAIISDNIGNIMDDTQPSKPDVDIKKDASIMSTIARYNFYTKQLEILKNLYELNDDEREMMVGLLDEDEKPFVKQNNIEKLIKQWQQDQATFWRNILTHAQSAIQSREYALKEAETSAKHEASAFVNENTITNQQQDLAAAENVLEKLKALLALKQELQQALAELPDNSPLLDRSSSVVPSEAADTTATASFTKEQLEHDCQALQGKISEQEKSIQEKRNALNTTTIALEQKQQSLQQQLEVQKLATQKAKDTIVTQQTEHQKQKVESEISTKLGVPFSQVQDFIKILHADLTTQDKKAKEAHERNKKHDLASITDDIARYKANADILKRLESLSTLSADERTAMRGVLSENEKAFVKNQNIKTFKEKLQLRLTTLEKNIQKNAKSAIQSCQSALEKAEESAVKAGDDFTKDKTVKNQQQDLVAAEDVLAKLKDLLALKQGLQKALAELPDKSPLLDSRGSVVRGSDSTSAQPTHDLQSRDRQGVDQLTARIIAQEKIIQEKQDALKATMEKVESERDKLRDKLRERARNSVTQNISLQQTVNKQGNAITDLQTKVHAQEHQLIQQTNVNQRLTTANQQWQNENAALQTEVNEAERKVEESLQASEIAARENEAKTRAANERNADLQTRLYSANSQLVEAQTKIKEVEDTNATLHASVVQANAASAQLQRQVTVLQQQISEVQLSSAATGNINQQLTGQLKLTSAVLNDATQRNATLQQNNNHLELMVANLSAKLKELSAQINTLQNSEQQATVHNTVLTGNLDVIEQDRDTLQQQLQELRTQLTAKEAELEQTKQQLQAQSRQTEEPRRETERELIQPQPHSTTARLHTAHARGYRKHTRMNPRYPNQYRRHSSAAQLRRKRIQTALEANRSAAETMTGNTPPPPNTTSTIDTQTINTQTAETMTDNPTQQQNQVLQQQFPNHDTTTVSPQNQQLLLQAQQLLQQVQQQQQQVQLQQQQNDQLRNQTQQAVQQRPLLQQPLLQLQQQLQAQVQIFQQELQQLQAQLQQLQAQLQQLQAQLPQLQAQLPQLQQLQQQLLQQQQIIQQQATLQLQQQTTLQQAILQAQQPPVPPVTPPVPPVTPPAASTTTTAQTTSPKTPLPYATKARHVAIFKEFAGEMLASVSLVPPLGPLAALAAAANANAGLTAVQGLYAGFHEALQFREEFLHERLKDRWGEMVTDIAKDDTYFAEIKKEAKKLCDAKTSLENRITQEKDIETLIKIASTYNDEALAEALETSTYKKESFYDLPQKLLLDKEGITCRVTRSKYVRKLAETRLQVLFDASRDKNEKGLTGIAGQAPIFNLLTVEELKKANKKLFKKMQQVRDQLYKKDGPLGLIGETFKDKVERLINDRYFAFSPEFQASARHRAEYFEEKLKALTKDGEDIISVLEKQRAQLWEQLDSLPSAAALQVPGVDGALIVAVNEQRALIDAEIGKIDEAMEPLETLMERMHGDGDEKHRPDWRYGLLETMQHAKSNYSSMRVSAGSLQVSYKDMSLEDLKTELQSKPNATDITATGNVAVGGNSSKYGLAAPIEAGKVRVYEIGEVPPPSALAGVGPPQTPIVHGRFMESYTTEQAPQLKVLKFPTDHDNKVKIALAMATQLLAGLKYIPSKKTPIRVENGTSDELKYILAALYALGKTSKTFDETCIQVTSGAKGFDKKDEWKSTIGIGTVFDTGLCSKFMKLTAVASLADDTKAVFTAKFFSNYKRDKKWRGADDVSQNRGVGEREHDLSGIGKITEKFKGKLQEINPEHDAAEAAKHFRHK